MGRDIYSQLARLTLLSSNSNPQGLLTGEAGQYPLDDINMVDHNTNDHNEGKCLFLFICFGETE
jgi:hypothetical protein